MPEFYLKDIHRQELLSVRDLLSHSAGVSDSMQNILLGDVKSSQDSIDLSRFFNNSVPFRSQMTYNNLHYIVAGALIENLTDPERLTWEDALTKHIFEPLGMNGSGFANKLTPAQMEKLAIPHEADWRKDFVMKKLDNNLYNKFSLGGPAATTIVTSARDLAKWLYLLTHEGRNEAGEQVIDADVIKATMTPTSIFRQQQQISIFEMMDETYGLGWYLRYNEGRRVAYHAGYEYGYHSLATVHPDHQLAVMTCSNGQKSFYGHLAIHLVLEQLLLDPTATQNNDSEYMVNVMANLTQQFYDSFTQQTETKQVKTKDELKEYVGRYGNYAMGNISVEMNESTSRLVGAYGELTRLNLVESVKADVFIANFTETLFFLPQINVTFGRNESGQVVTLTVPFLMPDDPPVFTRGLGMSSAPRPLLPGCPVAVSPDMDRANCSTVA